MTTLFKTTSLAAAGLALSLMATASPADAYSRRGVAGAVIGGVVVGSIIAGAAAANARERVYVRSSGCGDYRRRAIYNEEIGRHRSAAYYWDKYHACRGD